MDIIKNVHMTHFLPEFVLSGAGTRTTVGQTENLASNAALLDRFNTVKEISVKKIYLKIMRCLFWSFLSK